jgi:hypothetical protein
MARIRTVKPSFFSDAKVCKLSVEAQLLFIGMWCFADCEGYLWDDPDQIQLDVFPSRPHIKVAALVEELLLSGMVVSLQTTIGRDALWIRKLTSHQRIKNESASIIAPLTCAVSGQIRISPDESANVPQEGKGREGKGRGLSEGGDPSDATPKELVSFYAGECKSNGWEPVEDLRNQIAKQVVRLLKEKPGDLIRSALRIAADERKSPSSLPLVIADIEAGRYANGHSS